MGRTQATYRRRLQSIQHRYQRLLRGKINQRHYDKLWVVTHTLSGPSSTLPYPDTHAILTFSMILELIARIEQIKTRLQ